MSDLNSRQLCALHYALDEAAKTIYLATGTPPEVVRQRLLLIGSRYAGESTHEHWEGAVTLMRRDIHAADVSVWRNSA